MTDKHWNWDHLRYFLALAEHGTLTAAGRQLDVSHSTVLRRIRAFENSLKTRLFEHTSTGYYLTSAGNELHEQAKQMQFTLDAVARDISGADQEIAGEVVIATTDSLSYLLLPEVLKELSDLHNDISFKVLMGVQMRKIEDREVDIAIRTSKEPPESVIGRQVGKINFRHQYTSNNSPDRQFCRCRLLPMDEKATDTRYENVGSQQSTFGFSNVSCRSWHYCSTKLYA